MRTCLLVVLAVLVSGSVAFAAFEYSLGPEYNATEYATCERKDPFDEYIYHAPMVDGLVMDASPEDWDAYPKLEWAAPIYSLISEGQGPAPTDETDYDVRFKLAWGYVDEFPVFYFLSELSDSDQAWDPEGSWNTMDVIQFWFSEHLYDYDVPVTVAELNDTYGYKTYRQMNIFGIPGWGIRMNACADGSPYCLDEENQPLTYGDQELDGNHVWVEARTMMFDSYENGDPWSVIPGESCLGIGFSGFNDWDPGDGSFSYMTWGQSIRAGAGED